MTDAAEHAQPMRHGKNLASLFFPRRLSDTAAQIFHCLRNLHGSGLLKLLTASVAIEHTNGIQAICLRALDVVFPVSHHHDSG